MSGGKTSSICGTYPTPARATSSGGRPLMSRSPTKTRPEESRITPVRAFIRVDLPDPFGPTTDATVRGATETDTPWMMSPAPYPARTSSARSAGAP